MATETEARCPHCDGPLTPGGVAIVCAPDGRGGDLALPAHCASRQCQARRNRAAIEDAIARGLIDP